MKELIFMLVQMCEIKLSVSDEWSMFKATVVDSWWRGVVASVVRRMNEVTLRRARLDG